MDNQRNEESVKEKEREREKRKEKQNESEKMGDGICRLCINENVSDLRRKGFDQHQHVFFHILQSLSISKGFEIIAF